MAGRAAFCPRKGRDRTEGFSRGSSAESSARAPSPRPPPLQAGVRAAGRLCRQAMIAGRSRLDFEQKKINKIFEQKITKQTKNSRTGHALAAVRDRPQGERAGECWKNSEANHGSTYVGRLEADPDGSLRGERSSPTGVCTKPRTRMRRPGRRMNVLDRLPIQEQRTLSTLWPRIPPGPRLPLPGLPAILDNDLGLHVLYDDQSHIPQCP